MSTATPRPKPTRPAVRFSASSRAGSSSSGRTSSPVCSSDDDGVFFGQHHPEEAHLLAELSRDSPITSTPPSESRRSSLRSAKVKKRDSREFIRRKTLLLSVRPNLESECPDPDLAAEKVWEGGFYEKRSASEIGEDDDSDDDDSEDEDRPWRPPASTDDSPSKAHTLHGRTDLTPNLTLLQISESTSSAESAVSHAISNEFASPRGQASDSEGEQGDSDKENTVVPPSYADGQDQEESDVADEATTVRMGMDGDVSHGDWDQSAQEIDMGGLCLEDLSDPEMGHDDAQAGAEDDFVDVSASGDEEEIQEAKVGSILTSHSGVSLQDSIASAPATIEHQNTISMAPSVDHGDVALSDSDSPLPIARGGPVVIPQFSHLSASIRADAGSPCRSLPTNRAYEFSATSEIELSAIGDPTVHLDPLTSPETTQSGHYPRVPFTARAHLSKSIGHEDEQSPTLRKAAVAVEPKSQVFKHPVSVPLAAASIDRHRSSQTTTDPTATARAVAIRGQLDTVFASRLGPPRRTVSGSSSSSSGKGKIVQGRSKTKGAPKVGSKPQIATSRQRVTSSTVTAPSVSEPRRPIHSNGLARTALSIQQNARQPRAPVAKTGSAGPSQSFSSKTSANVPTRLPLVPRAVPPAKSSLSISTTRGPKKGIAPLVGPNTLLKLPTKSVSPQTANPIKRSLHTNQPTLARALVATGPAVTNRPTLGLPSRIVREASCGNAPVFSMGAGGSESSLSNPSRGGFRSPGGRFGGGAKRPFGTPCGMRLMKPGTPSRIGTPSRNGAIRPSPMAHLSYAPTPVNKVAINAQTQSSSRIPVKSHQHEHGAAEISTAVPGARSSEDHEEVSLELPLSDLKSFPVICQRTTEEAEPGEDEQKTRKSSPSPEKSGLTSTGRARRITRPPQTFFVKQVATVSTSGCNISEKELKAATQRNTSRNEVYHCAIERQIVRKHGPRPPSPTSKIRTTADREEAERKVSREERAKRRSRGSEADSDTEAPPLVQRISQLRGPGEEEDYVTPARPVKKAKTAHVDVKTKDKVVRWDRGLVVIRHDGSEAVSKPSSGSGQDHPVKASIRNDAKVQLDPSGNVMVAGRPQEALKRHRIVVTAVFYAGEEPVPPSAPTTKGKK